MRVVIFIFMFLPFFGNAQNKKGEVIVSLGAALSPREILLPDEINESPFLFFIHLQGVYFYSKTPVFNGAIDLGINSKFSLGLAYSKHKLEGSVGGSNSFLIKYKGIRHNVSSRFLFHTRDNDIDVYYGGRVGFNIYTKRTEEYYRNRGSDYELHEEEDLFVPCLQGVLGLRYYPIHWIGFNVELGIGSPYMLFVGVVLKFSNKSE